jgi:hypothetical protein
MIADPTLKPTSIDRRPPRWRRYLWAGLVLVAILVIVGLVYLMQTPANGKIIEVHPSAASQANQTQKELVAKTFRLSYPGDFEENSQPYGDPKTAESYLLKTRTPAGYAHIAIASELYPDALDNASGLTMRRLDSATYKLEKTTVAGEPSYITTRLQGGYEHTLFALHQGRLVTISYTTDRGDATTNDQLFAGVVASFKWVN